MTVEIGSGIVCAVSESDQNQEEASTEQAPPCYCTGREQTVGNGNNWPCLEMFAETPQIYDRRQQHAYASSISEDTCPADCFQRAICQADIMNEKDTDGQQHCPRKKN